MEAISPAEHEALMEHRRNEFGTEVKSLSEVGNCLVDHILNLVFKCEFLASRQFFCLCLEGQPLCMVEFSVCIF